QRFIRSFAKINMEHTTICALVSFGTQPLTSNTPCKSSFPPYICCVAGADEGRGRSHYLSDDRNATDVHDNVSCSRARRLGERAERANRFAEHVTIRTT